MHGEVHSFKIRELKDTSRRLARFRKRKRNNLVRIFIFVFSFFLVSDDRKKIILLNLILTVAMFKLKIFSEKYLESVTTRLLF